MFNTGTTFTLANWAAEQEVDLDAFIDNVNSAESAYEALTFITQDYANVKSRLRESQAKLIELQARQDKLRSIYPPVCQAMNQAGETTTITVSSESDVQAALGTKIPELINSFMTVSTCQTLPMI